MAVPKTPRYLFIALCAVLLVGSVQGLNQHINISISETVNQNVTFAQNFDLSENRTYSLIEGVIIVLNPGTESVFDINIRLDNVSALSSNFSYVSGRQGYQVIYPHEDDTETNLTGQINSTAYLNIGDLDEDGVQDSVTLNDTHLIFNMTSEYQLFTERFYNSSNSSMDISVVGSVLGMRFNITSNRTDGEYNDGVVFATIDVDGVIATASVLELVSEVNVTVNNSIRDYAILHIPELRSGNQSEFHYNVSASLVDPPLDINSSYDNAEFQTKVLAGERFTVRLSANNIATVGALENVNITLRAEYVNVTNISNPATWEIFNFTLHNLSNLSNSDDWANVDNASNITWYWNVNGGTISVGEGYNISFQIRAPDSVGSSGTFLAMTQVLAYQIATTGSTLAVSEVRGRSRITFNTTKQIVSPQDNNSNNNVTWRSVPTVGTGENITYTLEQVTLWVTQVRDPNQEIYDLSNTYTPSALINLTTTWQGGAWRFNFTDGSSDAAPPPIVWIKPYWIIRNTGNQIVNSSFTVNGTDLYMNYIYVVNGYWLEVQKNVIDAGTDQYNIFIYVTNRGNGYTPQNLTVTVYDFIPSEFVAYNFSPTFDNSSNVTGEFAGIAYQWDVGLRTNLSTSFAPRGDPLGLDEYTVNYTVNGSGDFRVSDLYIVGLDPRLVDGANTFQGVSVIQGIASTSTEVIYLAIVVFLIAINLANFLMTSKINKKLDK